jgi:UDP-N-acetylenolpyruvoylglucosamine reductase
MKLPHGLQEDIDITHLSAFKTPARTRYFYDITEREEALGLKGISDFAKKHEIPLVIIGAGTNCLFAFDVFDGIIVRNRNMGWEDLHNIDGQPFIPQFIDDSGYQKWSDIPGYTYVRVNSGELSHNIAMKLYTNYGISTLVPWIGLP